MRADKGRVKRKTAKNGADRKVIRKIVNFYSMSKGGKAPGESRFSAKKWTQANKSYTPRPRKEKIKRIKRH